MTHVVERGHDATTALLKSKHSLTPAPHGIGDQAPVNEYTSCDTMSATENRALGYAHRLFFT